MTSRISSGKSLAIAATHPIQYYAPLYRALAAIPELELKVFYHHIPTAEEQGIQFGKSFRWDVDLMSGYPSISGEKGMVDLMEGITQRRWSAVLAHGWFDGFSKRVIAHALKEKVPVMVRGDSHLKTPRPLLRRLIKFPVYRWLLPKMAACLAVGTWSRDYYLYYGVPETRIFRSPHCVDNAWFQKQWRDHRDSRTEIRLKWNIPPGSFVFLFTGRMDSMKRVDDFLEAFRRVRLNYSHVHALLVGDGPILGRLKNGVRDFSDGVTFTGFLNQSEIPRAYLASDCLVLPSSGEETWGLVVNEAMNCGLRCLVSDQVGCGTDMILPGDNGDIFPCGDIERLKEKMEGLLSQSREWSELPESWKKILEIHSCESAARGIWEGFENVVNH